LTAKRLTKSLPKSTICRFGLLADTERKLSESFGTYGEKKFMGRTYMGNHRMTFLVDEKGKIKKIFPKVKPEDHAEEVLAAFQD
jgi:peroxiredoxin Q/BCP